MSMKASKTTINPFKIPVGYLEGFEVSLPKKVKNTHAKSDKQVFKVPENYFKNFKIDTEKLPATKHKTIPLYKKYSWLAAAVVLMALIATPIYMGSQNALNSSHTSIATTTIDGYWEYATDALTTYDMAAYIEGASFESNENTFFNPDIEYFVESQMHPLETIHLNTTEND